MTNCGRLRVFLLMATDAVCLVAVWCLTLWGYRVFGHGHYKFGVEFYLRMWPVVVAFLSVNWFFCLYHGRVGYPASPVEPVEELRRLVGSSVIVHLGAIAALALAFQTTEHYSRAVIVLSGILTAGLAQPFRDLSRRLVARCSAFRIPAEVTGPAEGSALLKTALERDDYAGFRVVNDQARVLFTCERMESLLDNYTRYAQRYSQVVHLQVAGMVPFAAARPVLTGGFGGLELVNQRKMGLLRVEKWLLDKILTVVAFVALLPFFVVVPVLIRLTSRGPAFYRHGRLGRKGRPIRVWKFRTMYADADERLKAILSSDPARKAEWEANFKLSDDPRVTPLGKFLRKTSIDEFPQLFNVFAGDMALVGPRPIVEKEVAHYGDAYETFSSVKPGITGLWQASGRSDTDYARRVALDVQYVLNWSPWMDIWILFRTVGAVLFMRGAR